MNRREFPRRIKAQIIQRAMNKAGEIVCEGCDLVLGKKLWQIDHTVAEALVVDKTKALTKEDGKLLGLECCHAPKTVNDVRSIAKAVRVSNRHLGIKKPTSFRKPPGTRYDWSKGRYTRDEP